MACAGNILFTLSNGQYTATTAAGTLLVIACRDPGGVLGWYLTATRPGKPSAEYTINPTSTCTPLKLIFNNVLIDCGTIDITLSSDLGPCQSSSSSETPSSVSASSDSAASGETIDTPCCSNGFPTTLTATPTLDTNTDCPTDSFSLTYNNSTQRWEGTYAGAAMSIWCDGTELADWKIDGCGFINAPINPSISSCNPINLGFEGAIPSCCTANILDITVTV